MSQKDQEADENKSIPLEDDVETPKETAGFESEICRFTLRDCHQSIHFTLVPLQLYVLLHLRKMLTNLRLKSNDDDHKITQYNYIRFCSGA